MTFSNINPKYINKLKQKKIRKERGEFIIEGIKGVKEALKSDYQIKLIIIENSRREENSFQDIINLGKKNKITIQYYSHIDIKKLKTTDTFPGIMAIIKQIKTKFNDILTNKIICLDEIKDPGNLGTIIRTADWFGIKNIILSENCVELYNPKTIRSTMGSIFHINIYQSNNLKSDLLKLKREKYILYGMTLNGESLNKLSLSNKCVYIFGSESHGIRLNIEKIFDKRYTILGKGQAESLNVAISVGILLNKIYNND